MKVTLVIILCIVAVGVCSSQPYDFRESPKQEQNEQKHEQRERRSPTPDDGKKHAKVGIYEDSRKGPVAKVEGSGTVWESRDKQIKANVGVDYTQPLTHGRGEGSAFFKVEGTF